MSDWSLCWAFKLLEGCIRLWVIEINLSLHSSLLTLPRLWGGLSAYRGIIWYWVVIGVGSCWNLCYSLIDHEVPFGLLESGNFRPPSCSGYGGQFKVVPGSSLYRLKAFRARNSTRQMHKWFMHACLIQKTIVSQPGQKIVCFNRVHYFCLEWPKIAKAPVSRTNL